MRDMGKNRMKGMKQEKKFKVGDLADKRATSVRQKQVLIISFVISAIIIFLYLLITGFYSLVYKWGFNKKMNMSDKKEV